MDARMNEMNNLRVLNDYINQTLDVLVRQPRLGQPGYAGFSPFSPIPGAPSTFGTDTVYGPWQATSTYSPFGAQNPFTGLPLYGAAFGPVDPFLAQRGFGTPGYTPTFGTPSFGTPSFGTPSFGPSFGPSFAPSFGPSFAPTFGAWPQQPWSPMVEATRQAHINQALAAKQQVLEAMCRACGIPV
jgi:hypothetical protein